jgi:hypothetical protein
MSKALILAGAGASRGSWDSVVRAIQHVLPGRYVTQGNANFIFAKLISELRWLNYKLRENNKLHLNEKLHRKYTTYKGILDSLRFQIASCLEEDQKEKKIYLDRKVWERIHIDHIGQSKVGVATTNWDTLFEPTYHSDGICYLHGSIKNFENLYLPTETIEDDYRLPSESAYFSSVAAQFMNELENIDKIVIYGLSFSPLDSELGTLWTEGFAGRTMDLPEVTLLDPNPQNIVENLKYLTPQLKIKVPDWKSFTEI